MRRARMKASEGAAGYYHCVSRVVDRRWVLGEAEKERFVALMREYEDFCGVRVLTYCLLSNHFHLLVEVSPRPETLPLPQAVLAKLRRLSGHVDVGTVEQRFRMFRETKDTAGLQAYLETFYARMWDVSSFMKLLKQRFTQWYNGRQGRKGTLWEERFKSVLVEGAGPCLAAMAAYIDLNPVRAGLVKDPKDYRWSGYGEALAGKRRAREGVRVIATALSGGGDLRLGRALELYRMGLFHEGTEEREAVNAEGRLSRGALRRGEVLTVLRQRGRLPLRAYVRCRVRYFCDGAVLGSRRYVNEVFQRYRERFGGRRKDGARPLRGCADRRLFTLRDLRLQVFG